MMLGRQWRMPSLWCYNAVLTTLEGGDNDVRTEAVDVELP